MASRKSLLIVDTDTRSLRVLEVSLRKAGFAVHVASRAEEAWRTALDARPDLIITDTTLPDESGFALARRLRDEPATAEAALIFLSSESSPDAKMRAIESGADDFLAKPVLVKEIASRARALLERRDAASLTGRAPDGHLRGTLTHLGVVDILQVMEAGARSGVVHLATDPLRSGGYVTRGEARATLYFREGRLVDAQLGRRAGEEALYRALLWEDGDFEIELADIERPDLIGSTTPHLLLEGMRRVDEWSRLIDRLPQLTSRPTVDYPALGRRLGEIPEEVRALVHLLDGQRTLFEAVDLAPVSDLEAIGILSRLLDEAVLAFAEGALLAGAPSLEDWLSRERDDVTDLPTALGQAVIPSPHSPSELLAAAEPARADELKTSPPRPTRGSSIVLSRRTVPANRPSFALQRPSTVSVNRLSSGDEAGSAPKRTLDSSGPPAARSRETSDSRVPRLSIQRVSSIISPASPLSDRHEPGQEHRHRDGEATVESQIPPSVRSPTRPRIRGRTSREGASVSDGPARAEARPLARSPGPPLSFAPPPSGHEERELEPSVTREVPAPAPQWSPIAPHLSEAEGEELPVAPSFLAVSGSPSSEPSLVIAPRRSAPPPPPPSARPTSRLSGHENGSGGSAQPADIDGSFGHRRTGAGELERQGLDRPDGPERPAGLEQAFFSSPAGSTAADREVDWGQPPPRGLLERVAPLAVVVTIIVFVGVVLGPRLWRGEPDGPPAAEVMTPEERARAAVASTHSLGTPSAEPAAPSPRDPETQHPAPGEGPARPAAAPPGGDALERSDFAGAEPPSTALAAGLGAPASLDAPAPNGSQRGSGARKPPEQTRGGAPAFERALPLPDKPAEVARSGAAEAALRDAEDALRAEDLSAAKSRFQSAIRLDRRSAAAHSGLAYTYLAEENLSAARRAAFSALRLDKADARANLVLGTIEQTHGNLEAACRRYRRYLELGGGPMASEIRSIVDLRCGG